MFKGISNFTNQKSYSSSTSLNSTPSTMFSLFSSINTSLNSAAQARNLESKPWPHLLTLHPVQYTGNSILFKISPDSGFIFQHLLYRWVEIPIISHLDFYKPPTQPVCTLLVYSQQNGQNIHTKCVRPGSISLTGEGQRPSPTHNTHTTGSACLFVFSAENVLLSDIRGGRLLSSGLSAPTFLRKDHLSHPI